MGLSRESEEVDITTFRIWGRRDEIRREKIASTKFAEGGRRKGNAEARVSLPAKRLQRCYSSEAQKNHQ